MTTPLDMDFPDVPTLTNWSISTGEATYTDKRHGRYLKLPEGTSVITVTNRSKGRVEIVVYDGTSFDNEATPLEIGETRTIRRVLPAANWGARIDLVENHPKVGWVGVNAITFPNTA